MSREIGFSAKGRVRARKKLEDSELGCVFLTDNGNDLGMDGEVIYYLQKYLIPFIGRNVVIDVDIREVEDEKLSDK